MAETRSRIVGSGHTAFLFMGQPVLFMTQLADREPTPHGGSDPVQSLDSPHPDEIVSPTALTHGELTLTVTEFWTDKSWERLGVADGTGGPFSGDKNIVDVLTTQLDLGNITCVKLIKNKSGIVRTKVYHGCKIVKVSDGDTVNIKTLTVPRTIDVWYTHATEV